MNARIDLLVPSSTLPAVPVTPTFGCCATYAAGIDTPPALLAGALILAERSLALLARGLRAAAVARQ